MFDDLLLLKRGGNVVFFGELGHESANLVEYFEARGAAPIAFGENPAAWMLQAYAGEGVTSETDWAESFKSSEQFAACHEQIEAITESADEKNKIEYKSTYATSFKDQLRLMCWRLYTIYRRSPAYNLARLMIAIFYSFIIGSVFLRSKDNEINWDENQVDAALSTMFLSLIIM